MSMFAVLSDIHCHDWSLFSRTNSDGVNSRLQIILDEMLRSATVLHGAGGRVMIWTGDIFHTRGVINPEVLNPLRDTVRKILEMGIDIYVEPGNHDLKSRDTCELSSAVQNLEMKVDGGGELLVINKVTRIVRDGHIMGFVPWRARTEDLLADLELLAKSDDHDKMDVFIHVGIDGVLPGMPASGITDKLLGKFGFRHIFAGDYHNHKVLEHGVISVGATTHQTWGDVGSKAGFLLVDGATGRVTYQASHAPSFIDLTGLSEDEMQMECDGNYVRFRGPPMSQSDINKLKEHFLAWGAKGVSIEVPRALTAARSTTTPATGLSIDQSVANYVDGKKDIPAHINREAVKRRAVEVLDRARTVYEEA